MDDAEIAKALQHLQRYLAAMQKWNDESVAKLGDERGRLAQVVAQFCTPRDLSCAGISYGGLSPWNPAEKGERVEEGPHGELHVFGALDNDNGHAERQRHVLRRVDGQWLVDGTISLLGEGEEYATMIAPELARRSEALWLLYEKYALISFVAQKQLLGLVGNTSWQFDKASGTLSFGNGLAWKCQVLGTEAENPYSWLWAWANEASQLPPQTTRAAAALKKYGEEHGIRHFVEPELPLNEVDGAFLATLATGLLEAKGYYRGPYNGGAIFLLITDDSVPGVQPAAVQELENAYAAYQTETGLPPSRRLFREFLRDQADLLVPPPEPVTDPALHTEYDELGRVKSVQMTVQPGSEGLLKKVFDWMGRLGR